MDIIVNGTARRVENETRLDHLLEELGLDSDRVAVERNHDIVPREDFERTMLQDGDNLEIVQFVGGG